jgi:serine/threonine protein kinase/Tol biopolymer transport system component
MIADRSGIMDVSFVNEAIQSPRVARFESFEVNLLSGELLKNGERIKMPEQSFQILAMLLERTGEVVARKEIQKRLWPNDTIVEFENSINAAIKRLRVALGDSADEPRYIETLARRGYRWKTAIEWVEPSPPQQPAPVATALVKVPDFSASRLLGKKVSHYRVLEILGGGGMGLVYKAEDIKLGRRVALKFLPEELAGGASALERFEREARAASALNDPNICTIHEIEEYESQPFIVMELLEGQTLRELIASFNQKGNKEQFGSEKLLDVATQIASGLGAAHKKGIIHRDIKPANIFVTTTGQAKILDFGLAKLQHSEVEESKSPQKEQHQSGTKWNPHTTLTRTGVTIGTAGYMSPEQIRGEKLDTRTDLFSFGLVLYEMATGQRAFTGDTAPVLESAILHHDPKPLRELNREISPMLDTIINKALTKDRELRYRSVSDMRADLEMVKRKIAPRNRFQKWILAGGAITALLIGGLVFWFARYAIPFSPGLPDVKLTQLTDNSPDNPVSSGAISPDGKYFAYTDLQGVHIKLVGSEDALAIRQPAELENGSVVWELGPWFPDSKRFIVRSHPAPVRGDEWFSADTSNWIVSVLGGAPVKLRDSAYVWSISPDGSMIAFGANFGNKKSEPGDETWLMSPDGTQARRIFPRGDICCVHFSEDGKRISYLSGDRLLAADLSGGSITTLLSCGECNMIGDGTWLPQGRFIYFDPCKNQDLMRSDTACNYWITRLDLKGGMEKPRRLTNWVGVSAINPSATADGKQVTFVQSSSKGIGYLADLDANGARIITSRRFPLEEGGQDSISEWTADGKNAIVGLNRFDHYSVRMQALNSDSQTPIVASATGLLEKSAVSPDGKWLILLVFPAQGKPDANTTVQLMRVPITGGTPEPIFSMREGSSVFCSRPPATLCAVAEESQDRRTMIVTAFDPVKGRGSELARFDLIRDQEVDPHIDHLALCDISPDSTRLAVVRGENEPIEVHSLRDQPTFVISAKRLRRLRAITWAANEKGFFASNWTEHGREVVRVDLRGKIDALWTCSSRCDGTPSPDGRHLGIYNQNVSANMWMMENF